LVAAAKCLVAATKKIFVVSDFVAVTKPFFSVLWRSDRSRLELVRFTYFSSSKEYKESF